MAPGSVHVRPSDSSVRRFWHARSRLPGLLALFLPLALPIMATAQQVPARLQLLVVDGDSGSPIAGVQVTVAGRPAGVLSGEGGMVELAAPLGDSLIMHLRMVGYSDRNLTAFPTTGEPLLITVPLELAPIPLSPVRVSVEGANRSRDVREFYQRAQRGAGQYLTRADIDRRRARNLGDLFRMLPGIALANSAMGDKPVMEAKGSLLPERDGDECSVQYFLDGTPINPPEGAIGFDVELSEVEGIEIYRRGTGVPARFQRQHGSCGVILIWKRVSLGG